MTGRLPDPDGSWAVLVGVSEYQHLTPLPAATNNVRTLADLLTNPNIWGIPRDQCLIVEDPVNSTGVIAKLHEAAKSATAALLFYFAGHGLLDNKSELRLVLPDGAIGELFHSIRFSDIRDEFVDTAIRCAGRVVLLDCCYSGSALSSIMSGPPELEQFTEVNGAFTMTATAEKALALAPKGERHTAFSGALLDILRHGVPGGPDPLDVETIFKHVAEQLRQSNGPTPQCAGRGDGSKIAIARNRALSSPITDAWRRYVANHVVWQRVPAGELADRVRASCVDFVEQLSGLRAAATDRLRNDPWDDREFAGRMSERIRWLVGKALTEPFSEGEAALLATMPFIYETYWAMLAARRAVIAPERWQPPRQHFMVAPLAARADRSPHRHGDEARHQRPSGRRPAHRTRLHPHRRPDRPARHRTLIPRHHPAQQGF